MIRAVRFCTEASLPTAEKCLEVLQFMMGHIDVAPSAFRIGSFHRLLGLGEIGAHTVPARDYVAAQTQSIAM